MGNGASQTKPIPKSNASSPAPPPAYSSSSPSKPSTPSSPAPAPAPAVPPLPSLPQNPVTDIEPPLTLEEIRQQETDEIRGFAQSYALPVEVADSLLSRFRKLDVSHAGVLLLSDLKKQPWYSTNEFIPMIAQRLASVCSPAGDSISLIAFADLIMMFSVPQERFYHEKMSCLSLFVVQVISFLIYLFSGRSLAFVDLLCGSSCRSCEGIPTRCERKHSEGACDKRSDAAQNGREVVFC